MSLLNYKFVALGMISVAFLGCEKPKSTVYEIPKEDPSVSESIPTNGDTSPPFAGSANVEILPGMQESADSAPGITYRVPEGWEELSPSGIRKANFKIASDSGAAEMTITTFPGDVGGTLANINRWRDQIGLQPITAGDLDELGEPCSIANHKALFVRLEGEPKSILGALLPFHGNTWFFKMMGDTQLVLANDEAMQQFLDSVTFGGHVH